jgi:hypothetical protein
MRVQNGMSALPATANADSRKKVMSALPAKADMCGAKADVRFGPKAGIRLIDKPPGTHLRRAAFRKMVSSKALEYRKNAELCEEEAERAPTEYFAEQFQKLAQHWWELVEYAEDKGF